MILRLRITHAIIAVDIPYATTKLERRLPMSRAIWCSAEHIGFKTIFDGAEFALEKLGYGLQEKTVGGKKTYEFKVNGVQGDRLALTLRNLLIAGAGE